MTAQQPEAPAPLVLPADEFAALKRSARILANIVARNHQAMEAARIEMRQNGPHAGMQWILNSLGDVWDDPETEWDGEESAQAWFDRTEEFYRATESAVDESAPVDTSRAVPARHAQRQERTGASQSDASESLGEVLHRARQAGGAGRPRPWPVEDWADRHPDLRALDEAMAEAVAVHAVAAERAKLAAIAAYVRQHKGDAGLSWVHAGDILAITGEPEERSDDKEPG